MLSSCCHFQASAIQTEAPSRVSFSATVNAWLVYDAFVKDQQTAAAAAPLAANQPQTCAGQVLLLPAATADAALSSSAAVRLERAALVVERMINQNIYDDIAQGN